MNKILMATLSLVSMLAMANTFSADGITRESWDKVIAKIEMQYQAHMQLIGFDFKIIPRWDDERQNAYGIQDLDDPNIRRVVVLGGMARSPWSSEDALAALLCHEVGHHLGGYSPKDHEDIWTKLGLWASAEGQADYFATLKCLRSYFDDQDNAKYLEALSVPKMVRQKCSEVWGSTKDADICVRSSLAGRQLLKIWTDKDYDFDTPDTSIVPKSLQIYPSMQCRLDTFFQGALCTADKDIFPSHQDHSQGVCSSGIGSRPQCWYNSGVL